eukprot:scaffold71307_cov35-Tisochrysis_lutea.AAC.2
MGASRPPHSIADTLPGGLARNQPQTLPSSRGWAPNNLTQTPSGRGSRLALPRPRCACPRAYLPPILGRQA